VSDKDNRRSFVLDTSALLTLIEDEDGADRVEHILNRERAYVPFMALLELRYISLRERGREVADFRHAAIVNSKAAVLWHMDEATTLAAAGLKAAYPISIADAVIATFALLRNAILVHKDPEYQPLADKLALEQLPLKRRKGT
jgi:predicted nucleic acid-binding protein